MSSWWHAGISGSERAKAGVVKEKPFAKPEGLARYDSSSLKTALQKMARRGRAADAIAIAQTLIRRGDAGTIRRRWLLIVSEDLGWRYAWQWLICLVGGEPADESDLLKLIWVACQGVKDKSCEPLMGRARLANRKMGKPALGKFEEVLRAGDLEYVSRVVVDQLDPAEKGGQMNAIWADLADVAKEKETERPGIAQVVAASRRRLGQGLFQNDRALLTIATAQAVLGKTYTHSPVEGWLGFEGWQGVNPTAAQRTGLADVWWCFDQHGWIGKAAARIIHARLGIDVEWLSWAAFIARDTGSGIVTPAKDHDYLDDWDRQAKEKFGESLDEMTAKWNNLRPEVEEATRRVLRERELD